MTNKIEILAPVGNEAMLEAAIAAEADAIYLGGEIGSARAYANNFTIEELKKAVRRAHLHQMNVYLTLNTLIKEEEMDEILDFAHAAYHADIDAIILHDLGLAAILRTYYPEICAHASTQMNLSSLEGVTHAQEMGMTRVILARETTEKELRRIHDAIAMEMELFVHGSLCVSNSGQCYMSSFFGGRSGNRGRCAQVCRKTYRVERGDKTFEDTFLSLRDLRTLDGIDRYKELGIASLKIEGRMKKPAYVYGAVKAIRSALQHEPIDPVYTDVSTRAFTKGLTFGDFGKDMAQLEDTQKGTPVGTVTKQKGKMGIRVQQDVYKNDAGHILTEKGKSLPYTFTQDAHTGQFIPLVGMDDAQEGSKIHRVYSNRVEEEMHEKMREGRKMYAIKMHFIGKEDHVPCLYAYAEDYEVIAHGRQKIQKANKRPVAREDIIQRLEKLGDTVFICDGIEIELDKNVFFPIGELAELRREVTSLLADTIAQKYYREPESRVPLHRPTFEEVDVPLLTIEIQDNFVLDGVDLTGVDRIYTHDTKDIENYKEKWNTEVYYASAPVFLESEREKWLATDFSAFDGFLVKDTASMHQAQKKIANIVSDYGVHVMNSWAAEYLLKEDRLESYTASIELSPEEMEGKEFIKQAEVVVFGPIPVMTMRHCPFSSIKGCKDDLQCANCSFGAGEYLIDEKEAKHYVMRRYGHSFIFFHQCLSRIDICANSDFKPKAYRLRLYEDDKNSEIIAYAKKRLIDKEEAPAPKWDHYWQTSGYTKGIIKGGVE